MDYSLPAWLGALAGTIVGVAIYVPSIGVIEQRMRAMLAAQEHNSLDEKISIGRRVVLAIDVGVCATVGYWIGSAFGPPVPHL